MGVLCTDTQGLSLAGMYVFNHIFSPSFTSLLSSLARGTLKPDTAGLVAGIASQANSLKLGTSEDDKPTVVVEFDTG